MSRTVGGPTIPAEIPSAQAHGNVLRRRLESWLIPVVGPIAISGGVLAVLHSFAFRGLVSSQYPDILPFWLPTYCYLGKSLFAGHIPAWNPHVMGGVPFAADPQSGWLYFPPMLLFSLFSCGIAIRWFIVLQPILGGLGMYGFLRSEGLSRPASTSGGLALALPLAGSSLLLNLPFAGTMAWIAILLGCASRYLRAKAWPSRLAWLVATAVAWGQLVSANLNDGMALGSLALLFYTVAKLGADVRRSVRNTHTAAALLAILIVALPLVNVAVLLPRLAYLPHTSIGLGYERLAELSRLLTGRRTSGLVFGTGTSPTWPLRLMLPPGTYLGASALALAFAGWWVRSRRYLMIAFVAFGAVCYVFMLQGVARVVATWIGPSGPVSFYLHDPARFRFGLLIALSILVGLGVDGWRQSGSARQRALMLAPAILIWGVLGQVFRVGAPPLLFVLGAVAGALALAATASRPALSGLIPLVLLMELTTSGLAGQTSSILYRPGHRTPELSGRGPINALHPPTVPASRFLDPGPIARALASSAVSRFMSLAPAEWDPRGYHVRQQEESWGLLGMQQSMTFGLEEAQGYNPTQLLRFWKLVRTVDPKVIRYNAGYFVHPLPVVFDLLQVGWLIAPAEGPVPAPGAVATIREGRWALFRMPSAPPRASLLSDWIPAQSEGQTLALVNGQGFDPSRQAVIESSPLPPSGPPEGRNAGGRATFRWVGEQSAAIAVDTPGPAILLVRNAFDSHWHATLDGQSAKVLLTDYLLQGLRVSPGHHIVSLGYDDPTIGYGLAGSGGVIGGLLATAIVLGRRKRQALV